MRKFKTRKMFEAAEKQRAVSKMPLTRFDSLEEMEAELELELLNSRLRTLEGCHYKVFGSRNGYKWVSRYGTHFGRF